MTKEYKLQEAHLPTHWVMRGGEEIRIEDMSTRHLLNTVALFERDISTKVGTELLEPRTEVLIPGDYMVDNDFPLDTMDIGYSILPTSEALEPCDSRCYNYNYIALNKELGKRGFERPSNKLV